MVAPRFCVDAEFMKTVQRDPQVNRVLPWCSDLLSDVHLRWSRQGCSSLQSSLVQHDVLNDAIFDLQTLHNPGANIKNEINVQDK